MTREFLTTVGVMVGAVLLAGAFQWLSTVTILTGCEATKHFGLDAETLQLYRELRCDHGLRLAVPTGTTLQRQHDGPPI